MSMRPARKIMKPPRDDDDSPDPIAMKGAGKKMQSTSRNIKVPARLLSGSEASPSPKGRNARKRPVPVEENSDPEIEEMDNPATMTSANHNKYCHFCQHVKVRASSMLACENQECCRRFCEHCLLTHLNEDVDPDSSAAWSIKDGKPVWHCPICRKRCCCSMGSCEDPHRHCKAYRYRRRRAELASKRMSATLANTEKRVRKTGGGGGGGAGGGQGPGTSMDDVLGGIYGHMGLMSGEHTEDDLLLHEANLSSSVDMDEALWLKKTYETVYNPVARLHALSALTPDTHGAERKGAAERGGEEGLGCLGGLAGGRQLLGQEERGVLDLYGGEGGRAGGGQGHVEGAARKCTVMYDFL